MDEEWITDPVAIRFIRETTHPSYSVGAAQVALDEALGSGMVRCRRTAGVMNWWNRPPGWKLSEDRLRWVDNIGQEVEISHREINKDDLAFFCTHRLAVGTRKVETGTGGNISNPSRQVAEAPELPVEDGIQPPRWIIPAEDAPRSQVAVWAARKIMRLDEDWAANGIPRRLKDGKIRSFQKLADEVSKVLNDRAATPFIDRDDRDRLRGAVSLRTIKRALGLD